MAEEDADALLFERDCNMHQTACLKNLRDKRTRNDDCATLLEVVELPFGRAPCEYPVEGSRRDGAGGAGRLGVK